MLDAKTFEVKGRWENGGEQPPLNYDFWYQPRKNVLVSSEFAAPNTLRGGFELDDVEAGRYGQPAALLGPRRADARADDRLRRAGLVPLEMRGLHDPEAGEGFVGAALSSTMWRCHRTNGAWRRSR